MKTVATDLSAIGHQRITDLIFLTHYSSEVVQSYQNKMRAAPLIKVKTKDKINRQSRIE